MIEPFLRSQLEPVARRRRIWGLSRDLAACWAVAALISLLFYLTRRITGWLPAPILPILAFGALAAALWIWNRSRRWRPDYRQIARDIEQHHPDLHALLLTAVEQQPDSTTGQFNVLQERLIQQAAQESARANWINTISTRQLVLGQAAQLVALVLLLVVLAGLRVQHQEAVTVTQPTRVQVSPGDTTLERGNGLAVL